MHAGKVCITSLPSKAQTLLQAAGSEPGGCQTSFVLRVVPLSKIGPLSKALASLLDSREELYALPLFTQVVCCPLLD